MTNYNITIGYKAVVSVDVKAKTEAEAKEKALKLFKEKHFRDKILPFQMIHIGLMDV